jgi:hypothetical protein
MTVRDATPRDLDSIQAFLQALRPPGAKPRTSLPEGNRSSKKVEKSSGWQKRILDHGCGHVSFVYVDPRRRGALAFWEQLGFREFNRELSTPFDSFKERL